MRRRTCSRRRNLRSLKICSVPDKSTCKFRSPRPTSFHSSDNTNILGTYWKVFLPNSFPGYISWEQYEANQEILRANAQSYGYDRRRSPVREGAALLQGLVLCGKCGDRMTVRYYVRKGQPLRIYTCQRRGIESAKLPCQVIPGSGLDEIVSGLVLEAVSPASLEVALEVFE